MKESLADLLGFGDSDPFEQIVADVGTDTLCIEYNVAFEYNYIGTVKETQNDIRVAEKRAVSHANKLVELLAKHNISSSLGKTYVTLWYVGKKHKEPRLKVIAPVALGIKHNLQDVHKLFSVKKG